MAVQQLEGLLPPPDAALAWRAPTAALQHSGRWLTQPEQRRCFAELPGADGHSASDGGTLFAPLRAVRNNGTGYLTVLFALLPLVQQPVACTHRCGRDA